MSSIVVESPLLSLKNNSLSDKKVSFSNLGCKVNTFETEIIAQKLTNQDYQRVSQSEQADLHILNTCTVTAEADRQARQYVRRAIKRNPNAWIVVTGCYAQMDPEACAAIPGVDLVVGNSQKLDIPNLLDELYRGNLPPVLHKDIDQEISLPKELLQGFDGHSRAFVQIQQGCDQGCTFCIIHTARGPNRSFSHDMIVRQCHRLVLNGYREIVLCGVDIGSYGSDFDLNEFGLAQLLDQIMGICGDFRIRLSSIDPIHINDELVSVLAKHSRICPQLHLSLQSGNSLILKRMKRRATREIIYQRIEHLRRSVPDLVLSADILVGFPTETEEQFEETCKAIEELEIPYPHVFSYSKRPGTPAARIPRQVPINDRKRRAAIARELGRKTWERVAKRLIGKVVKVVPESRCKNNNIENNTGFGRSEYYFPVEFQHTDDSSADEACEESWINVKITGMTTNKLLGSVQINPRKPV